jgi:hypothetical protein
LRPLEDAMNPGHHPVLLPRALDGWEICRVEAQVWQLLQGSRFHRLVGDAPW